MGDKVSIFTPIIKYELPDHVFHAPFRVISTVLYMRDRKS
jgi:hypothetical protein